MPLAVPTIDDRDYRALLDEALARIPVHTPEWTNYGPSDPGRSLVELFCFLAEDLLFRANQIPERNRKKFMQLLGLPLEPGSAARGIVAFENKSGPRETLTLNADLELRAGRLPFQTARALDVLPIEGKVYYKRRLAHATPEVADNYRLLYASYRGDVPSESFDIDLYESVLLTPDQPSGVDLTVDAIDASLWIALLARPNEPVDDVRKAIAGKTLSLGLVPATQTPGARLPPAGNADRESEALLRYELPAVPEGGRLPNEVALRVAKYKTLDARSFENVLVEPGVVEITLPSAAELQLWQDLDPLEPGVGDFPPALSDTNLDARVITWLRVRAIGGADVRLMWVGINATPVEQRTHVSNEVLEPGTGQPDQSRQLALKPVIPGSVGLEVVQASEGAEWQAIDDLFTAGPEVQTTDFRLPPGQAGPPAASSEVFSVNYEAAVIQFGDGLRGKRPPDGARLIASYNYSQGAAGNVERGSIKSGPALPAGLLVDNPVRTWGGADPESIAQGEKQVARYLQHRERLVTVEDFQTIVRRAPGVQLGRLEVLPAFHPDLSPNEPGDAAGVVTLLVIPSHDREHPAAPEPDRAFLDALCRHIDPRRLVTTEVLLRGPTYVPIDISVGINLKAGYATATVRETVKRRLLELLAPVYANQSPEDASAWQNQGWPLRKSVLALELMAEASRAEGVLLVNDLLLARRSADAAQQVSISGLELPQVVGISVQIGAALPLEALRGTSDTPAAQVRIPVPFVPEQC